MWSQRWIYGFRITSQASRHKTRNHKLRRCRFRAIISTIFNYRCCPPIEQGRKKRKGKNKMIIDYWLFDSFSAISVAYLRNASHGDFSGILSTFRANIRIILNIFVCRILYVVCDMSRFEWRTLSFIIYYWLFLWVLGVLCGQKNQRSSAKSAVIDYSWCLLVFIRGY